MNIYETEAYSVDSMQKIEIVRLTCGCLLHRIEVFNVLYFHFVGFDVTFIYFFHMSINSSNADVSKEQNVHAACDV